MRYYSHMGVTYAARNKYFDEIQRFLKGFDGLTIADVSVFMEHIVQHIKSIHQYHPRCKPVSVSFDKSEIEGDEHFYICFGEELICSFFLYQIRGIWHVKN